MAENVPENVPFPLRPEHEKWFDAEDREAFQKIEALTAELIGSLKKRDIREGGINDVVGLDAAGHVPALLIAESIAKIREKRGQRAPGVHFLSGQGAKDSDTRLQLPNAFKKFNLHPGGKTLVVDDTFETGDSAAPVLAALKAGGRTAELLIFSCLDSRALKRFKDRLDIRAYAPKHQKEPIRIFKRKDLSGVTATKDSVYPERWEPQLDTRDEEKISAMREIVDDIARRVADRF